MFTTSAHRAFFTAAVLISALNAQTSGGAANSCTSAIAQESQLVATNMTAIQKQYVDAETQYNQDTIACGGGQGAAACIAAARTRLTQSRQQIDKQKAAEIGRHKKALIGIQNGACSGGSSTSGQSNSGSNTTPSGSQKPTPTPPVSH